MRIVITGSTGLLGKALIGNRNNSDDIVATYLGNYTLEYNLRHRCQNRRILSI